jgi:uncharacterized protein (DUF1015 family)
MTKWSDIEGDKYNPGVDGTLALNGKYFHLRHVGEKFYVIKDENTVDKINNILNGPEE